MLVTMRGDWGEFNPAQVPMGQATQTVLEAMGDGCAAGGPRRRCGADRRRDDTAGLQHVPGHRDTDRATRAWAPRRLGRINRCRWYVGSAGGLVRAACWRSGADAVVIAGLGAPAWDITAAGDCALNLPLWGGMGGAAMIGLGLALAQPERQVLVITGDGEMLMGLGASGHDRRAATAEPRDPGAGQRTLWRDGDAGDGDGAWGRPDRDGGRRPGSDERCRSPTVEAAPGLWEAARCRRTTIRAGESEPTRRRRLVLPPREGSVICRRGCERPCSGQVEHLRRTEGVAVVSDKMGRGACPK